MTGLGALGYGEFGSGQREVEGVEREETVERRRRLRDCEKNFRVRVMMGSMFISKDRLYSD